MSPGRLRILHLALAVMCLAAYSQVAKNDFIDLDDATYITDNPDVREGLTRSNFVSAWTKFLAGNWHPATVLSLQLDAQFFSWRAADGRPVLATAVHLHNLAWHIATTLLLFALWRRLTRNVPSLPGGEKSVAWCSFVVAALFAVHPLHVESVVWAAERKDVLSAFLGLLTIWVYVGYAAAPGPGRYLAVLAAFTAGLLCKPMLVTLPCLLLLLDYWPLGRTARSVPGVARPDRALRARNAGPAPVSTLRLVIEKLPLFALAGIACVLPFLAQHTVTIDELSVSDRLANAAAAYGWYLAKTFWPAGLAVFYPHRYDDWQTGPALAGLAVLGIVTVFGVVQARRRPWLIVGWLWFLGTLVPVIGLVQVGKQAHADRYTYLPHIGLFVVLAWGSAEILRRWRCPVPSRGALAAVALAALACATWRQVGFWRNTLTIWNHAVDVDPDNYRAHSNLGEFYFHKGPLSEARRHYERSAALQPEVPEMQYDLGVVLRRLGHLDEAGDRLEKALALKQRYWAAWNELGLVRLAQGRLNEAEIAFRNFQKTPAAPRLRANLGLVLLRQQKHDEAAAEFQAAFAGSSASVDALNGMGMIRLWEKNYPEATKYFAAVIQGAPEQDYGRARAFSELGVTRARQGDFSNAIKLQQEAVKLAHAYGAAQKEQGGLPPRDAGIPEIVIFQCRLARACNLLKKPNEARQHYQQALAEDRTWPAAFTALAWKWAADPDSSRRDPVLAFELASQACEATSDPPAECLDVLAVTLAAQERFTDAVDTAKRALAKATADNQKKLADDIAGRLKLFEQKKPYVMPRAP